MRARWPKLGTRVHVEWMDCAGYIGVPLSEAKPLPCWTEGVLVKSHKDYVVLASSMYSGEGSDPTGDFTAIPKGWVRKVKSI